MAENKIQYSARTYDDYRKSLLDISRKYYPDMADSFNDASVGQWLIELCASVGDELSYHIDRTYQETSVTAAGQRSSLNSIARNNGIKIPGKKAAIVEIELSCELPLKASGDNSNGNLSEADTAYAPIVKRGALFSTGLVTFELVNDVNFGEQFDENGMPNRQIIPNRDSNGNIISYTYKKLAIAVAGQSKVYKKIISNSDLKPFMSVLLQDNDILGVESILVKEGGNLSVNPQLYEYSVDEEEFEASGQVKTSRFFEVDSLIDQYRFGYETEKCEQEEGEEKKTCIYNPKWYTETEQYEVGEGDDKKTVTLDIRRVVHGKWKRLKNKFITEFTDNNSLKITFGSGIRNKYGTIPDDARSFTKYVMSRMEANDYLGVLPGCDSSGDSTMYILYRVGGGEQSNIAAGSLTNIINISLCIEGEDARKKRDVTNSIRVTNTTPSYGGKDEPSEEEMRQIIKYNSGSKNRCVTLHDYIERIAQMPPKYGTPFRCGAVEENNKIIIYALGLDSEGHLESKLSEFVAKNMTEYLSMYRTVNDFVEIHSGKIINISFEIDVCIDKTYEKSEVVKRIIELVTDYMDIRRHVMGDEYYVGDIMKEISKLDGVKNLIDIKVYNKVGDGYSDDETTQQLIEATDCCYEEYNEGQENFDRRIDLKASDNILFTDANSLLEIRYPNKDIKVNVRQR